MPVPNAFGARAPLGPGLPDHYRLSALASSGLTLGVDLGRAPVTLKILLENALRHAGGGIVREEDVAALAAWRPGGGGEAEVPFMPSRVVLQDFTGVPAVVDLAAMRDAMASLGGDPGARQPARPRRPRDRPLGPDRRLGRRRARSRSTSAASTSATASATSSCAGPRPRSATCGSSRPGTGIIHQVNLEFLASVVADREDEAGRVAFPDTLVGTDSHTTMINGLGVLGYGVGGIEAEAVLLGQPLYQPMPRIVGVRLHGELPRAATATDLVLVITERLRGFGVVGAFVEFAGDGLAALSLADRATISNMSPEFGATSTLFPIDDETLAYLRLTGRSPERVDLVERYAKAQGLWREPGAGPEFDALLELDLGSVEPSLAGPRRPQDRVALGGVPDNFRAAYPHTVGVATKAVGGSRAPARDRPRVGDDRGDHVLHEHVQPGGHGGRRPAGAECRRAGACGPRRSPRPRSPPAPAR